MIINAFAIEQKPGKWKRKPAFRTTSGCYTCRVRHLKCDEVKPRCTRCQKSGFNFKIKGQGETASKIASLQRSSPELQFIPSLIQASHQDVDHLIISRIKHYRFF
ncbi:hypothetical protein B0J14DRAFT_249982 [Halenospora varia]|nr:hypothetical protein B0J14DRAFT_249982 [Halenospora varia]